MYAIRYYDTDRELTIDYANEVSILAGYVVITDLKQFPISNLKDIIKVKEPPEYEVISYEDKYYYEVISISDSKDTVKIIAKTVDTQNGCVMMSAILSPAEYCSKTVTVPISRISSIRKSLLVY